MEATLTPTLALDYLRELSTDVRASVLLDAAHDLLAGPPVIAAPARELVSACAGADETEIRSAAGFAFVAVSPAHGLVVVTGPLALPGLVFHDMAAVMALLVGPEVPSERPSPACGRSAARAPRAVRVRRRSGARTFAELESGDPRFGVVAGRGAELIGHFERS